MLNNVIKMTNLTWFIEKQKKSSFLPFAIILGQKKSNHCKVKKYLTAITATTTSTTSATTTTT